MRRLALLVLSLATLASAPAQAYPWMIKHGYSSCAACHVDPSGAGLLTPYGHGQQEIVLTAHYGTPPEEVDPEGGLFSKLHMPDWLNAGFSIRAAQLVVRAPTNFGGNLSKQMLMIGDLRGEVSVGHAHLVATLGFEPEGALLASVTQNDKDNLVSREHWIGVDLFDQAILIKGGRTQVPFGLRNVEHPSWVRSETRTDLNSSQQYGVSVAYNRDRFRAELMGIVGNFALTPADYRERGYSGYAEFTLAPTFTLGVSSLVTHAGLDYITDNPDTLRQAHGLFSRWGISDRFALLAEADALIKSSPAAPTDVGYAGFSQLDAEVIQGLHLFATLESLREYGQQNYGEWGSVAFFLYSNTELRVDGILRQSGTPNGFGTSFTVLGQLHLSM